MRRWIAGGALVAVLLGAAACSDGTPDTNAGEAGTASARSAAPAQAAGTGEHGAMHGAMTRKDADPSRNFALNMIEHHQGAVTMSQAALQGELDPEMRALAQKVIADQEREIAQMQAFLQRSQPAR